MSTKTEMSAAEAFKKYVELHEDTPVITGLVDTGVDGPVELTRENMDWHPDTRVEVTTCKDEFGFESIESIQAKVDKTYDPWATLL